MSYDKRLEELQITLPPPPVAGGLYIPALKVGNQLWVSGQIPKLGRGTFLERLMETNSAMALTLMMVETHSGWESLCGWKAGTRSGH